MKKVMTITMLMVLMLIPGCRKSEIGKIYKITPTSDVSTVDSLKKDKILYINSYHADFPWSEGIQEGILRVFNISIDPETGQLNNSKSRIDLRIYNMNTKNDPSEKNINNAVLELNKIIEDWTPQLVIASEDNASKYLIEPYYKNSSLPFVFCGVNWDASVYGFPTENITGMVEVSLIPQLVDELLQYSDGNRVAYLKGDSLTAVKEAAHFEETLGYSITKAFASSFSEWQEMFIGLQNEVDILLTAYPSAMTDWDGDREKLKEFMHSSSRIPTGSWDIWLNESVLITMANTAAEQGEWAAEAALQILDGTKPSEIPISKNKNAAIYLNMALAKKLSVEFPMELISKSHLVNAPE